MDSFVSLNNSCSDQSHLGLELGDHWSQKQKQVESLQPRQNCGDRIVCGGARRGIRQQLLAADNGSVDSFDSQ